MAEEPGARIYDPLGDLAEGGTVPERVRYSLFFWEAMQVLKDAAGPLAPDQAIEAVRARVQATSYEAEVDKHGRLRWVLGLQFDVGDAATVGWMTKRGGWAIVESGIEALDTYPTPEELHAELRRRYREINQRRKQAQEQLSGVEQFVAQALDLVEPGEWTSWDDLATLVGTTPQEVGHFLASGKIQMPNAYRVLTTDGKIPDPGMLNVSYRGVDLQQRLAQEGVHLYAGAATQDQRLPADELKDRIEAKQEAEAEPKPASAKRAWMVRGSNVDGYNLSPIG